MTFTFSRGIKQQTMFPVVISLECMLCQLFSFTIFSGEEQNDISTAGLGAGLLFCELVI